MASNPIQWYENSAFDAPELKSPQPCIHGSGCVFTIKDAEGKVLPGVCRFVHPGEEGKGRRLFPERMVKDTGPDGNGKFLQPACVRLIGAAGYYERMRLKMPWQAWCAKQGLPFTPNIPGVHREPVKRVPIGVGRESSLAHNDPTLNLGTITYHTTWDGKHYLTSGSKVVYLSSKEATDMLHKGTLQKGGYGDSIVLSSSARPTDVENWPVLGCPERS